MRQSHLRQLIREEIARALDEERAMSPAEIKKHMNTAAANMEFAKEVMKSDRNLGKQIYDDAERLWQSMENLMKQRRRRSA